MDKQVKPLVIFVLGIFLFQSVLVSGSSLWLHEPFFPIWIKEMHEDFIDWEYNFLHDFGYQKTPCAGPKDYRIENWSALWPPEHPSTYCQSYLDGNVVFRDLQTRDNYSPDSNPWSDMDQRFPHKRCASQKELRHVNAPSTLTRILVAEDKVKMSFTLPLDGFEKKDLKVKVGRGDLVIEGERVFRSSDGGSSKKKFIWRRSLPKGVSSSTVKALVGTDKVLRIIMNKKQEKNSNNEHNERDIEKEIKSLLKPFKINEDIDDAFVEVVPDDE